MENIAHREQSQDNNACTQIFETAILSVPDFDGNGRVDSADVEGVTDRSNTSEGDPLYHPLYVETDSEDVLFGTDEGDRNF